MVPIKVSSPNLIGLGIKDVYWVCSPLSWNCSTLNAMLGSKLNAMLTTKSDVMSSNDKPVNTGSYQEENL
jgi:hypothetical protein